MHPERARQLNQALPKPQQPVVYWMSRDQRVDDNWALLHAASLAQAQQVPLAVVFCLQPSFLGATWRQYDFMLSGLQETFARLRELGMAGFVLNGGPTEALPPWLNKQGVGTLVTDFSPLRIARQWKVTLAEELDIPLWEVDAHNVIPCWHASDKQEFAARTFRPKVQRVLEDYLTPFPSMPETYLPWPNPVPTVEWNTLRNGLHVDSSVDPTTAFTPGTAAALGALGAFIRHHLTRYDEQRNDPNSGVLSNLSPYLHFGQISAQRVALAVRDSDAPNEAKNVFLEELIVRRELSDNFCYYNPDYDRFAGLPNWAQTTLNEHSDDPRDVVYTREQFEQAQTHEPLWNAAQQELILTGKMHGYLRMYWAKKILEWSASPEAAIELAIYLNDKYELDGRDPNGYVGVLWSIGGVHDRPWQERPVYGKIRYMNANGARRKFDTETYIRRFRQPGLFD